MFISRMVRLAGHVAGVGAINTQQLHSGQLKGSDDF